MSEVKYFLINYYFLNYFSNVAEFKPQISQSQQNNKITMLSRRRNFPKRPEVGAVSKNTLSG